MKENRKENRQEENERENKRENEKAEEVPACSRRIGAANLVEKRGCENFWQKRTLCTVHAEDAIMMPSRVVNAGIAEHDSLQ